MPRIKKVIVKIGKDPRLPGKIKIMLQIIRDPLLVVRYLFQYQRRIDRAGRLRREGRYAEASAILEEVTRRQPGNLSAQILLARIAMSMEDHAKAEMCIDQIKRQAERQKIRRYGVILRAADILRQMGRGEEGREMILRHAPPEVHAESYLALASHATENTEEWEGLVNRYLAGQGLSGIRATRETGEKRIRLRAGGERRAERGPLVSVIMSAYNMQDHIRDAMRSILEQTWEDIELVVVDDRSRDGTAGVVREMMQLDDRVRLIELPVNVGTYVCRNIAFGRCKGEFVAIQDADDWCHPERIRTQVEDMVGHPERIANIGGHVRMNESGVFELEGKNSYTRDKFMPSIMVRKERVMREFGYWDSVRIAADTEFWKRVTIFSPIEGTYIVPQVLVFYTRREDSLTMQAGTRLFDNYEAPSRREYKLSYQDWQKNIRFENYRIPFPLEKRPFDAPASIAVPLNDVLNAINGVKDIKEEKSEKIKP